ncbi:hypothetical protein ACWT_3239 [Actinoplanes sp. SE50]|nr:hypothetical protein ACPL_3367 [Actinoplanes sp. SE50/110]ATO82654.1 hypothetical protein ACWT_3239 [Actinoplanes sp. SE50]SLM00061.1 hypothetical protein ACSP50_3293 [Actinoplanes sp. SE50/110]
MATTVALLSVPLMSLLCCVPGFAALGGMDSSCGTGFDHDCLNLSRPVFTVWPWVTGGIAAVALVTRLAIPRRAEGLRLVAGAFIVVPPLVNAVAAFAAVHRPGVI